MGKLSREDGRRILHDAGLRATAPRVAVLRLLSDTDRPLSHAEVVERIGTDDWDAATLYRNLIKLDQAGLARVASRVGGVTRFEAKGDGEPGHVHPHFACRDCGNVICLHDATLSFPKDDGWREALSDADLQVVGRCPSCRSGRKPKSRASKRAK